MNKKDWNFDQWCRKATCQIGYKPDRNAVAKELRAHLDDAFDAAIARGMNEEEAAQKALEAMGSAYEIAPQLAAIHKPFWGYVIQVSQFLLLVLLVLSLIPIWKYTVSLRLYEAPKYHDFDLYNSASYGGETGRTLHHLSQPDLSFRSDGNTFTVTDAVVFTEYFDYYERDITRLYILIRQTSMLPWQEHTQYFRRFQYDSVLSQFFVRDDKGNEYRFIDYGTRSSGYVQSGIFASTHQCWIHDFPSDAKWAEVCYERDGRSFALRIDLAGGDRT